jgi:hypothetical protein
MCNRPSQAICHRLGERFVRVQQHDDKLIVSVPEQHIRWPRMFPRARQDMAQYFVPFVAPVGVIYGP